MFCKCGIIELHRKIQKGGGSVKKDVKVIKGDTTLKRTAIRVCSTLNKESGSLLQS